MNYSKEQNITPQNRLAIFQDKEIRRTWHKDEWYYSLVDIVAVLSDSKNPTDYLKKIRKRDEELKTYIGTNCPQVEMKTESGKNRKTLSGNSKDVFRLIQSIPPLVPRNLSSTKSFPRVLPNNRNQSPTSPL